MKIRVALYLGLLIQICGGTTSPAQDREYIYDHFNISNGLVNDNVFKVFLDQEGHAWIITYNGLQKFNGYEFKTFTSSPVNRSTLSSNYVVDMFEDRDGDLIVVLDDGIDIYDKYTNSFRNLISGLEYAMIRRNEISRLSSAVQDKAGSIWVNCNNQLVRIDSTKHNIVLFPAEYSGHFVLNPDSSVLWINTDQAIKKFDLNSNLLTITNISDIPSPVPIRRLNTLFYDSNNICWVGTTEGLFVLDEFNFRILDPAVAIPGISESNRGPLEQDITAIYEDFEKDLWFASSTVLYRIYRNKGITEMLQHEFENANSLREEQITGIHGNQTGLIWVTYLNEGFTRINIRSTNNFKSYRHRSGEENSLGGKTVRSIFKDNHGFTWVGMYNNGLDRIDPGTGIITHFKNNPADQRSICSNYISSLFVDSRQRLWVGSHNNGLCFTDRLYNDKLTFQVPGFLNTNDEIYHIQEDTLGRIWFGTRAGLGMYNYTRDEFIWVLKDQNVQSFIIDNQVIWIASWKNGFCKLCFQEDQFSTRIPLIDTTESFNYHHIDTNLEAGLKSFENMEGLRNGISIYQDQKMNIWLGTFDRGLIRIIDNEDGIDYRVYDVDKGAPGNAIYGVTGDQQGNLWISTDNGIGKFDPLTERFENYYREDGLLSNFFMWKSYFKAQDGELMFGSVDGLNTFFPDEIFRDTIHPRLYISEIRIRNQLIENGDTVLGDVILHKQVTYQDTIILKHRSRDFSFKFYATGYINSLRLRYSHMLRGYDDDWIVNETGNRNATYTNLSPGSYSFQVKVTDNKSDWSGQSITKMVVILPPWWKTTWAYIFYLLLIVGLVFLITHSLVKFLALKHELRFNEKLHQSKLTFFTNISHEFKTPLSLIKAPLNDMMKEKDLSPHNRKNLLIARKNADNLLNLVNELMEFRRTDTGNSKLRAEQIDLNGFIRDVAAQFENVAEQKGVHFYYHIPEEPMQIWVDPKKFRRIINNLLDNSLKYTSEEGLVTLSILSKPSAYSFKPNYHTFQLSRTGSNGSFVGILVSDNGLGISGDSLPRIFDRFYQIEAERASQHIGSGVGLALVKNLVHMHKGEIRVASERGKGTEILVSFPLGENHLEEEEKISTKQVPSVKTKISKEDQTDHHGTIAINEYGSHKTQPSILLVEDHIELRQYLKENLSDEYRVIEAGNGEEGMRMLSIFHPDLIITDWIMPVMDGLKFIKEIRSDKRTVATPVILLTAKDEEKEHQEGLESGADLVIPKPFNLQLLRSQVKRIIASQKTRIRVVSMENMENLAEIHENRDVNFLQEVERIISKHIRDTALNAGVIAREIGMSRTALYDKINSISGQTIGEYIQRIRLKHAIKLMLYENISVSEVYIMAGFSSSSYLIRLFKKYYQTTPGEYIRNYLKAASN